MMIRYHGPRDYLDAAASSETSPVELSRLAASEYLFVRLAVARNPNTLPTVLGTLVPDALRQYGEQEIAAAIAQREDAPADVLARLAGILASHAHAGRNNQVAFSAAVALCGNDSAPFNALQALLQPNTSKPQLRKVVARESRRMDVLQFLAQDPSSTVAASANESLCKLSDSRGDA